MMNAEAVRENVQHVRERIAEAAKRAGRSSEEIVLVAVSKLHPVEAIREAYAAGVCDFGENRVQEWEAKRGSVKDLPARWHMIGHVQSNKAARAAALFDSVDSVDSVALAQRLDRARQELSSPHKLRLLIEVRLAPEESKSGVAVEELPKLVEAICRLEYLGLAGLMCIPPFFEDAEEARPFFRKLRSLNGGLEGRLGRKLPVLSMGMSHDFEVAIEEGATEVRIGTAIFGARKGA